MSEPDDVRHAGLGDGTRSALETLSERVEALLKRRAASPELGFGEFERDLHEAFTEARDLTIREARERSGR